METLQSPNSIGSLKPDVNIILEETQTLPSNKPPTVPKCNTRSTCNTNIVLNTTHPRLTAPSPQPAPIWPTSASRDDCNRCDDPARHIRPVPSETKRIAARPSPRGCDSDDRAEVSSLVVVWWWRSHRLPSSRTWTHTVACWSGECRWVLLPGNSSTTACQPWMK